MTSVQKKWFYRALIMLIFIFAFGIRVNHLSEKKSFHPDEVLSVVLTDYKDLGWTSRPADGEYTGAELQNMMFNIDKAPNGLVKEYNFLNVIPDMFLKDTIADIFRLWDNNRDTPHTNFYYTLLRISLVGINTDDRAEFESQFIFRAGALNLALFSISFFVFFLFLNILIKEKSLILLGLVVAFLNRVDISTTMYFRPYALQCLFVLLFTAFLVWVSKKIAKGEYDNSWQNIFIFALPLSLMLLCGYYSFVYALIIGIFFVVFSLRKSKRLDLVSFFFFGSILAVLYDLLFYNNFMAGFYSYRTFDGLGLGTQSFSMVNAISKTFELLTNNLLYLPALAILIVAVIYKLIKKDSFKALKDYAWVISVGFLYSFVIIFIAPGKNLYYIAPSIFIISLIFPLVLSTIKSLMFKRVASFAIVGVFLFVAIGGDGIMHKYSDIKKFPSSLKTAGLIEEDMPVYLHIPTPWLAAVTVINLDSEQKYIVCNDSKSLLEQTEGKNCLVFFNSMVDDDLDNSMVDLDLDLTKNGFELLPEKFRYFDLYKKQL